MRDEEKTCHCGKPAVAKCPCCSHYICEEHLEKAAAALGAEAAKDIKERMLKQAGS